MIFKKNIIIHILLALIAPTALAVVPNQGLGINQKTATLATPINNDYASPIIIDTPGCYKLASNLIDKQIFIDADDVTILFNAFSIDNPTLNDHAIVINTGHSDITIQGGEISGNNFNAMAGIMIFEDCSNILIQSIKISYEWYGVLTRRCSDVLVRNCIMSNFGFTGLNFIGTGGTVNNIRIKQCVMSAPDVSGIRLGINVSNSLGLTVDSCTITDITQAINLFLSNSATIKNCIVNNIVADDVTVTNGIHLSSGRSNIIDNCEVNAIKKSVNGNYRGIEFSSEQSSVIKGCRVNNIFPGAGATITVYGILVAGGQGLNCIVLDNVVSNIFGNNPVNPSYGFANASATNIFVGNRAINCTGPFVQPYTGVTNVVTAPQATFFPWNWIRS